MKHRGCCLMMAVLIVAPAGLAGQAPPSDQSVIPAPASVLPRFHRPEPTTADITVRDLMTRLYIFADDSMQGREAGTAGNVKATDYLASEAKRLGLVPAGDSGTYFQSLPFKTRTIDSTSTLSAGGAALVFGTDWAGRADVSVSLADLPVIFGGTLGDSSDALTPDQLRGKLVVIAMPEGSRGMRGVRSLARMARGAAVVAVVGPEQFVGILRRPSTFLEDPASAPARNDIPLVFLTAPAASRLFGQPLAQVRLGTIGRSVSLDLRVRVAPAPFPSRNVAAILGGSDPLVKGEYVALGAHNDHIGLATHPVDHDSMRIYNHLVRPGGAEDMRRQATPAQQAEVNEELARWRTAHPDSPRPDSISNGADDDGSGSVTVLEIAEKLASLQPKPRRSILFVWHVGEEKGLLGSTYFTDHPTVPRDSIVVQLNLDMVGRGDAWDVTGETKDGVPLHGGAGYLQVVGSRRLSTELGDLIEQVNLRGKHGLVFDYAMDANGHPMNIYCRSDHYEYARYGIPIAFFTTGGHSDYHQVTDEPQYIDYQHMAQVAGLIEDVALTIANLDHRLVVDQPKPDPQGSCQQ